MAAGACNAGKEDLERKRITRRACTTGQNCRLALASDSRRFRSWFCRGDSPVASAKEAPRQGMSRPFMRGAADPQYLREGIREVLRLSGSSRHEP